MFPIKVVLWDDEPTYGLIARMAVRYGIETAHKFQPHYHLTAKMIPDPDEVERIAETIRFDAKV